MEKVKISEKQWKLMLKGITFPCSDSCNGLKNHLKFYEGDIIKCLKRRGYIKESRR